MRKNILDAVFKFENVRSIQFICLFRREEKSLFVLTTSVINKNNIALYNISVSYGNVFILNMRLLKCF